MMLYMGVIGLLDGFDCSEHWEFLTAMQVAFPRVNLSASLFTLDRNFDTCGWEILSNPGD
jgi:transcriptional regulator GlxA family with amidase domain